MCAAEAERIRARARAIARQRRQLVVETLAAIRHSQWLLRVTRPWWDLDFSERIAPDDDSRQAR